MKKQTTHLRYFATFADLVRKVEDKLHQATILPDAILALVGKYCHSLDVQAATTA